MALYPTIDLPAQAVHISFINPLLNFQLAVIRASASGEPPQVSGPAEARVFRFIQGGGLVALPDFVSEIGTLLPIAPCGRT